METIAALFGAIARGLRGLFDLASMALGVVPSPASLADGAAASAHITSADTPNGFGWKFAQDEKLTRHHREALGLWDAET